MVGMEIPSIQDQAQRQVAERAQGIHRLPGRIARQLHGIDALDKLAEQALRLQLRGALAQAVVAAIVSGSG
jgi:hypothetical protein